MLIKSFDNIKIFYNKFSPKNIKNSKGVVIFIHGGFHGNNTLLKKLYGFFKKDYIIIAPDLRGRGDSDFPKKIEEHKLEDYAKDLYEILKYENIKDVYLVGTSFGGLVSLKFATMFYNKIKINKIVLISSNYSLKKIRKRTRIIGLFYLPLLSILSAVSKNGKIKKKNNIDYSDIKKPFFSLKYGLKNSLNNSLRVQGLRYKMMKKAMNFYIDNEDLKKINCKVLLIYGKRDFFFNQKSQKEILKNIKKSEIKIFPKSGHNLFIDNAKETSKIIKGFFNSK